MSEGKFIYQTALVLVAHFDNCIKSKNEAVHSRLFSHILHPEADYVLCGQSPESKESNEKPYPEHVVPCAVLRNEAFRLIKDNKPREYIAELIAKHWKIAYITQKQQEKLDGKSGVNFKDTMPEGWHFETDDSFARLKVASIEICPIKNKS